MKLYQIDSFTKEIFKGNPAGVCIVDQVLTDSQMQLLAVEMNLSETAFVTIKSDSCELRWFTPAKEVPLCGHATLATAFVLFEEGYWDSSRPIIFNTLSGDLIVSKNSDGSLSMNFPSTVPQAVKEGKASLEELFDGEVADVLRVPGELIVILKNPETLYDADPDSGTIAKLADNGVIVSTWCGEDNYDFASRYFAPNLGIKEDPVTGFMHTILTPYWSQKTGKENFRALQASKRSGHLHLSLKGERVELTGNAIKVFETEFSF
ncbi:PhzF family phenazine biosynthesis protein [Roseivirga sp.]|uniref:PhzF family phenazine biosynthesis protein n=1 Tax=Roseivirga sp. TaxID=1964215 RepID=UPI003B8D64C8